MVGSGIVRLGTAGSGVDWQGGDSMSEQALMLYSEACRAVEQAKTVDEVVDIRNKADALRAYARQAKNHQLEQDALEIRLRAERRMGQILAETERDPGGRPEIGDGNTPPSRGGVFVQPSLADLGVSYNLSARAQRMAKLDDDQFESYLAEVREDGETGVARVTTRLLDRVEMGEEREQQGDAAVFAGGSVEDLRKLVKLGRRFQTFYADPPWPFSTWSDAGKDRSPEKHYPTMGFDEIEALPIADLAADNATMHLWATYPTLPHAFALMEKWGFAYVGEGFTWIKLNPSGVGYFTGMGFWTRKNSEIVLMGTRGNPKRYASDVASLVVEPVGRHSEKPEEVRRRIERLVNGPYLELFARKTTPGWTSWGNEIEFTGEAAR
jgi:N6-adenosine-specific RNA methylase IME4